MSHPLVERLLSFISFSEDDKNRANIRLGLLAPGRDFTGFIPSSSGKLITHNWGLVDAQHLDAFVDAATECLKAGYRVSLDSRCDMAKGPIMFMVDVDRPKDKVGSPVADTPQILLPIFRALLESQHLVKEQKNQAYNLQVTVTENQKKRGQSFHLYFHNLRCDDFRHYQFVIRWLAEQVNPVLLSLGYNVDPALANMGSLRWPATYSFGSRHADGDDRHLVEGVYQPTNTTNPPERWGVKRFDPWTRQAQEHSPLHNVFSGDILNPLLPGGLFLLLRALIPWAAEETEDTTHFRGMAMKKRVSEQVREEVKQARREHVPEFDMRDAATFFDIQEARGILGGAEPTKKFFNYMAARVVMVNHRFLLKQAEGKYRMFTNRDLINGPMSMDYIVVKEVQNKNGTKLVEVTKSAWKWYAELAEAHHYHTTELLPSSPLDPQLSSDNPLALNVWTGFVGHRFLTNPRWVEGDFYDDLVRDEDFDFFMRHLHGVLLNNSAACLYRFLCWIRAVFISPQRSVGKIVVFEGPGGVGKSALADLLHKHVFGESHSVLLPNTEGITSRFNGATANAVVAFVDEGGVGDARAFNVLKQVTTAEKRQTERKFEEAQVTTAPLAVFFSVNSISCPLSAHERRYDVFTTNPAVSMDCGNQAAIDACFRFGAICYDPERARRVADRLVTLVVKYLDPTNYQTQKNMPFMTPGYVKMRKEGMSSQQRFWAECIQHVSNFEREPLANAGDEEKLELTGNWGTYIPYSWVERKWRNWRVVNNARSSHRETFLDSLGLFGCSTHTDNGVLWLKVEALPIARRKFTQTYAVTATEADLETRVLENRGEWAQLTFFKIPAPDDESDAQMIDSDDEERRMGTQSQGYAAGDESDSEDSDDRIFGCASDSDDE